MSGLESKRWGVDFGRDTSSTCRCQSAVPYTAKGVNSAFSSFSDYSHPEVKMGLTIVTSGKSRTGPTSTKAAGCSKQGASRVHIELPPPLDAAKPVVSNGLEVFVSSGQFTDVAKGATPAFHQFEKTAAGPHFDKRAWPTDILVTKNFTEIVKTSHDAPRDHLLRSVNCILCSKNEKNLLIISSYEAKTLLRQL